MATTKQEEQKRDDKGRITGGTPPVGFHTNPERRHNGAWKKEDTPRYKLEQMMKLSDDELDKIKADVTAPRFEKKLAEAMIDGNWNVIREMMDQVYGKAAQAVDVTTKGESINPITQLTAEELRKLAGA